MASNRIKPIVGIIHSDEESDSSESSLLAKYFGALLFLGEYSSVRITALPLNPKNKKNKSKNKTTEKNTSNEKQVSVLHIATNKPKIVVESEDFQMKADIKDLKDCHVIIVCVNPTDTQQCAEILKKLPTKKTPVGIFSFQYGCKNFDTLSGCLGTVDHLLFDGAVSFHIVKGLSDQVLRPLIKGQNLVLERLTAEKAEFGSNYVNLLSTMEIPILFRKTLTPFTWGSMVFNCHTCLNALTGDPMKEFMSLRRNRLLYAQMIRECLAALRMAAAHGDWVPDGGACCPVTLAVLEQALCLPDFIYPIFAYFCLQCSTSDNGSSVQVDLHNGQDTNGLWCMKQLIDVGTKYKIKMSLCLLVYEEIEKAIKLKEGVPRIKTDAIIKILNKNDIVLLSTNQLIKSLLILFIIILGLWVLSFVVDVLLPRASGM
mmetsp:Transcript_4240/g.5413  ORF Transcript_4240/g.5413 Transcript_4240/m.5413 type:complete len:429 (+) Transcript_4240:46-1332(+)